MSETPQGRITRLDRTRQGTLLLAFTADTPAELDAVTAAFFERVPDWARVHWRDQDAWSLAPVWVTRCKDLFSNWELMRLQASGTASRAKRKMTCPSDVAQDFAQLHLLVTASPEIVKAAYRILAKELHPDVGGTHAGMVMLTEAAERALAWAERMHLQAALQAASATTAPQGRTGALDA